MADTFRFAPPSVRPSWIERPRLVRALEHRYEVDVLVMAAPAGYGKTSSLGLALSANADQHLGVDLWFQCEPQDADLDVFAAGLLAAAGLPAPGTGFVGSADKVADAIVRLAPQRACLVLDDVHQIPAGSPGAALLDDLVHRLPANGHLVLAGRRVPSVRLARLRAQGRSLDVSAEDLAFDDDELDLAFPGGGHLDPAVARWPAMASLLATGSSSATVDFLLEEVAEALGGPRLASLTALSHVRTVDDGIARAASDGRHDAADLLDRLPLVLDSGAGTYQMHDLWRDALVHGELPPEAAAALGRVAEHVLDGSRYREAAELFAAASDLAGVERALRTFVTQPYMFHSATDLRQLEDLATRLLPGRPIAAMLSATRAMLDDELASADALEAAADQARAEGDRTMEGLALQYAVNLRGGVDPMRFPERLVERAAALAAEGDPFGESLHAQLSAHRARLTGQPEVGLEHLGRMNTARAMDRVQHGFALCDLGRPEEVLTAAPEDIASQEGATFMAHAIWLRGELSPELALEVGGPLTLDTESGQLPHIRVSLSAAFAFVSAAAGEDAAARTFADRALQWAPRTAGDHVRTFALLADAVCTVAERGDEEAAVRLDRMLAAVPIGPWPYRSYLYALPLIYVLHPASRAAIDRCRFGPALTTAQEAGRALVALRDDADPTLAYALPWDRPDVLRAHVLPPHLTELAAAAASEGHSDVGILLGQIPALRDHLLTASTASHGPTAAWARQRATALPVRPAYDLRIDALGPLRATRGATPIAEEPWVRRERVRQLLAFLVQHRRLPRRQVAERLWPDLPVDRAMQNLRVNLSHLQRVLQPDRGPDDEPWFVRADAEHVEVAVDGVDLDVDRFERACREARGADEAAHGLRAITGYREAADLFRGDYLADWPDAEWAEPERVRLRTLATASICRLGELLLARGEPEEATAWATRVVAMEPLLERGHRLFIRGLDGQGNRPASRQAASEVIELLAGEGLQPEVETVRLLDRLRGVAG
jgi:DNA-binding SARP family transcriptional activator